MTYRIHPAAPTDDDGNPVHPEQGYHICGRGKSENTTPTDHGRERDDVDYCMLRAGHGTENPKRTGEPGAACTHHGGDSPVGEDNPAFDSGAYSEFTDLLESDLSDREQDALRSLDLDEHGDAFVRDAIKEAYLKYKRTGDDRFLREVRQWMSEFNVVENTEQVAVDANVEQTTEHQLGDDEKAIARGYLKKRHKRAAEDSQDE